MSSAEVVPTEITIQVAQTVFIANTEGYQRLGDGSVLPADGINPTIQLSSEDLKAIKAKPFLADFLETTYISLTSSAITDFSRNHMQAISPSDLCKNLNSFQI